MHTSTHHQENQENAGSTVLWESPRERVPFPGRPDHVVGRADDHHGLDWCGMAAFTSYAAREEAIAFLKSLGFNYFTTFTEREIYNTDDEGNELRGPAVSWGQFQPSKIRRCAMDRLPSVKRARREERERERFWAHELK